MSPLRFLVQRAIRDSAQRRDRTSVDCRGRGGDFAPRRLVHEWHELVGEPWHRAADAYPADIRTASNSSHPATFGNVAIHHWSPATELHDALGRSVHVGK